MVAATASTLVSVPQFRKLKAAYPGTNLTGLSLVYVLYVLIATSLPLLGSASDGPLRDRLDLRVSIIVVLVHAAVWPTVCIPWIVRNRLNRMRSDSLSGSAQSNGGQISELLSLLRILNVSLAVLAGIISLAVLAAGQFSNTVADLHHDRPDGSEVVLYGMFFAGILAIFFVPVYLGWYGHAGQLRGGIYRIPDDGRPDAAWTEGRSRLSDLLHLDKGIIGSLGPTLSILLPVIAAVLGYFVPAG